MNTQWPNSSGAALAGRLSVRRSRSPSMVRRRVRRGFGHGPGATALAAVLALAAAVPGARAGDVPQAALERRVGHAYALDTGRLVYREIHEPVVEDGRLVGDRVTYVEPDGEAFAHKRVRFAPRPLVPAFRLEDTRTGYIEGLRRLEGGKRVELFVRKGPEAPMRSTVIETPKGLVADAGFDILIYRQLDRLAGGEPIEFPFAAPSQQDTIMFRLRRVDRREVLGEPAVVIRMEPANMFIRWLVDPIDVAYHAETGALLRYEGLSNIPDPGAEGNYRVRIDFPPPGAEPRPPGGD